MFVVCQGLDCTITWEVKKYEDVTSEPLGHVSIAVFDGISLRTLTANIGDKHKVQTISSAQWLLQMSPPLEGKAKWVIWFEYVSQVCVLNT